MRATSRTTTSSSMIKIRSFTPETPACEGRSELDHSGRVNRADLRARHRVGAGTSLRAARAAQRPRRLRRQAGGRAGLEVEQRGLAVQAAAVAGERAAG